MSTPYDFESDPPTPKQRAVRGTVQALPNRPIPSPHPSPGGAVGRALVALLLPVASFCVTRTLQMHAE
jgi:hypothetical protein